MMSVKLPLLVKSASGTFESDNEPDQIISPSLIMQEIAKAVYLEEVLFAKEDSIQRLEVWSLIILIGLKILSQIELALRMTPEELTEYLNEHLKQRMFLVGFSITAADIASLAKVIGYVVSVDTSKIHILLVSLFSMPV